MKKALEALSAIGGALLDPQLSLGLLHVAAGLSPSSVHPHAGQHLLWGTIKRTGAEPKAQIHKERKL